MLGNRIRDVLAAALFVASSGCFYSSTWHQESQSQRRQAESLTPEAVRADGATGGRWRATREVSVRAWASPAYRAEVTQWRDQIRDLLDRANGVLAAPLRIRLALADAQPWDAPEGAPLERQLDSIEAHDAGDGVDFVIAFVGSTPHLAASLEALGQARLHGKHIVLRAMNDAAESDAIEEGFDRLSDEERHRLRRRRKAHRELVVLLHEIGHALGALHVREPWALMNPTYDTEMARYAPQTLALLRPVLEHRARPEHRRDERRLVGTLLEVLREREDAWVPEERAELVAHLERGLTTGGEASPAPAAEDDGAGTLWDVTSLPESDRQRYRDARRAYDRRRAREAWDAIAPLVEAHPDVYAVQELACALYSAGAAPAEAGPSCQRMMTLATQQP